MCSYSEYGSAWLVARVFPVLRACHVEDNYQKRAVVLEALVKLAPSLDANALEGSLLPLALTLVEDKVPNLRLQLASSLMRAAPHLSATTLSECVMPILARLEDDWDMDVLRAAKEALEVCMAITLS